MNVVLCTVARNENYYINEWCHYYLNMGFSHIYLFDNNLPEDSPVENCLSEDIRDKVTIDKTYQGLEKTVLQVDIYNAFYKANKEKFDWCAFFDIDEFLSGIDNINNFVNQEKFNSVKQIIFKWKLFGDDDVIERDITKPVYGFFKQVYNNPLYSNQIKCMIRGNENIIFHDAHFAAGYENIYFDLETTLPSGKIVNILECSIDEKLYKDETIFLNHYRTKTLSEFMLTKFKRGDKIYAYHNLDLRYFFSQNKLTKEKEKWLKEHYPETVKQLKVLKWKN